MRVMTFNANGLRSAARKGFFEWFKTQAIDVLCVQETKAQIGQLQESVFLPEGYHRFLFDAEKPGYSGVAIYTRYLPERVQTGLGFATADQEGRYIQMDLGDVSIASLYLPSGSSGEVRQQLKFDFMERYWSRLVADSTSGRRMILCGDWNIVHREIDIKNFKSNQQSSGCLPEERAWLDRVLTEAGWVDAFRVVDPRPGQYTWWSQRAQARANNVGWRIDYQLVTQNLQASIRRADIFKDPYFSDHAPMVVEYDVQLSV